MKFGRIGSRTIENEKVGKDFAGFGYNQPIEGLLTATNLFSALWSY